LLFTNVPQILALLKKVLMSYWFPKFAVVASFKLEEEPENVCIDLDE
jgi:hypothetical protein